MSTDGGAVTAEDMQILASIIAERGGYDEPDSLPAQDPPSGSADPLTPLSLFPEGEPPEPSEPEPTNTDPPAADAAPSGRKRRAKTETPAVRDAHWHFSIDLERWSTGFSSEGEAVLAARADGHSRAWLGFARPVAHDKRMVAIDALDLLGYRLHLSDDQQTKFGESIIAAASKVLGPAVRVEPKRVVDLNRERPATFEALQAALEAGLYEERAMLFARDLSYVLEVDHAPIAQMLERYNPSTILGVLRTLYEKREAAAS